MSSVIKTQPSTRSPVKYRPHPAGVSILPRHNYTTGKLDTFITFINNILNTLLTPTILYPNGSVAEASYHQLVPPTPQQGHLKADVYHLVDPYDLLPGHQDTRR